MTLQNEHTSRRRRSATAEDVTEAPEQSAADEQPTSRRAARERERRAAELLTAGQQHPSGVLDFAVFDRDGNDFGPEFSGDTDFGQGVGSLSTSSDLNSTADIWDALARRAAQPEPAVEAEPVAAADPEVAAPSRRSARRVAREQELNAEAEAAVPVTPTPAFVAPAAPAEAAPARPLTRRELRAQQAAQTIDGMPASWFASPAAESGATPAADIPAAFTRGPEVTTDPQPSDEGFSGGIGASLAHPDYIDTPTVQMTAVDRAMLEARTPLTAPVDIPQFFAKPVGDDELAFSSPIPVAAAERLAAHPDAVADATFVEARDFVPVAQPTVVEAVAAPEQAADDEADDDRSDLAGFEALIRRSKSVAATQHETPLARQAASDDEHAGFSGLLSRNVATPHGSQNALILATDPRPDFTKAVTGTGELFITGSMSLPRQLATTGAAPQHYDSLEIDRLFEASQDEPAANVAPVRASRAVSGGSSMRAVAPRRTRSSALPTVLAVVAGVMALGVIGLLVCSWVLRLF